MFIFIVIQLFVCVTLNTIHHLLWLIFGIYFFKFCSLKITTFHQLTVDGRISLMSPVCFHLTFMKLTLAIVHTKRFLKHLESYYCLLSTHRAPEERNNKIKLKKKHQQHYKRSSLIRWNAHQLLELLGLPSVTLSRKMEAEKVVFVKEETHVPQQGNRLH